jgi:16S rRNA (cytosine967-C5)-methyltransferase
VSAPSSISPARSAAFEILLRVATRDSYAVELLHSNLLERLSLADRALTTELVMGVLRWQQMLDDHLQSAAGKSIARFDDEVKLALRLGAYQLLYLDRIPARAAVNESVELVKQHGKRSAGPLVNAVLRKLSALSQADVPKRELSAESLARGYSHPVWLVQRWIDNYGTEVASKICSYDQQRPATTIRSNPSGTAADFIAAGLQLEAGALVKGALRVVKNGITERRATSPGFSRCDFLPGEVAQRPVIQDEASQLVGLLAKGASILDCCAAPGGKSAIARERNPGALVVSADLHLHRVKLMRELSGAREVLATDARMLPFSKSFNCVIADLPCTGTGTLARNPEIKWRLTREDIPRMAQLQTEIIESATALVAPGGFLVYSTCSLQPEEGEEVVEAFVRQHSAFRLKPVRTRLDELVEASMVHANAVDSLVQGPFLRTIPGVHQCDGFFAAIIERRK